MGFMARYPKMQTHRDGSELLYREDGGKSVLQARHDLYVLNEFSREVLDLCDGTRSVADIAGIVSSKYGVTPNEAAGELEKFLGFMETRRLVVFEDV